MVRPITTKPAIGRVFNVQEQEAEDEEIKVQRAEMTPDEVMSAKKKSWTE